MQHSCWKRAGWRLVLIIQMLCWVGATGMLNQEGCFDTHCRTTSVDKNFEEKLWTLSIDIFLKKSFLMAKITSELLKLAESYYIWVACMKKKPFFIHTTPAPNIFVFLFWLCNRTCCKRMNIQDKWSDLSNILCLKDIIEQLCWDND